jgi:hypothetical protein
LQSLVADFRLSLSALDPNYLYMMVAVRFHHAADPNYLYMMVALRFHDAALGAGIYRHVRLIKMSNTHVDSDGVFAPASIVGPITSGTKTTDGHSADAGE